MRMQIKVDAPILAKLKNIKLKNYIYKEWSKETQSQVKFAREVAPKSKMKLQKAIYGRTFKKNMKAIIGLSPVFGHSGFDYSKFVTGLTPIYITQQNPYFKVGQTVFYGQPAESPSGNQIQWSSSTGWWDFVEEKAKKGFVNATRRARNKYVKAMNG
jgi:hypothetical protein